MTRSPGCASVRAVGCRVCRHHPPRRGGSAASTSRPRHWWRPCSRARCPMSGQGRSRSWTRRAGTARSSPRPPVCSRAPRCTASSWMPATPPPRAVRFPARRSSSATPSAAAGMRWRASFRASARSSGSAIRRTTERLPCSATRWPTGPCASGWASTTPSPVGPACATTTRSSCSWPRSGCPGAPACWPGSPRPRSSMRSSMPRSGGASWTGSRHGRWWTSGRACSPGRACGPASRCGAVAEVRHLRPASAPGRRARAHSKRRRLGPSGSTVRSGAFDRSRRTPSASMPGGAPPVSHSTSWCRWDAPGSRRASTRCSWTTTRTGSWPASARSSGPETSGGSPGGTGFLPGSSPSSRLCAAPPGFPRTPIRARSAPSIAGRVSAACPRGRMRTATSIAGSSPAGTTASSGPSTRTPETASSSSTSGSFRWPRRCSRSRAASPRTGTPASPR